MSDHRDDFDVDALLREPSERLLPPDGAFELITKRANRRKWVKAAVGVSAGVVIAAGAVPAVIAVRHNSGGEQSVAIETTGLPRVQHHPRETPLPSESITVPSSQPSSTPPVPTTLAGFRPDSLSFVSPTVGFLWGSMAGSHAGVVAKTTDGGSTWTRLSPPGAEDSASGKGVAGDAQIRFVSGTVGFVFGALTYLTLDGGQSWSQYSLPAGQGYVDDLEAMHQRFWALLRPSQSSTHVRLYTATAAQPSLQLVKAVKPMTAAPGADAIALNDNSVSVIAGSTAFWSSKDGTHWTEQTNPCESVNGVRNAELSTLNLGTIVAACGSADKAGSEQKASYVSHNWGKAWTPTLAKPDPTGGLQTLFAGTNKNIVVGTTAGAQVTTDAGRSWTPLEANGVPLGFIGYISTTHLVAVSDRAATTGAFATSTDGGLTWSVYSFGS
ncbi:MAG TPA: hypothetical protein VME70_13110 [Mycobacteriales bacterium]|nr:hypothetical protein [Mycobacteriales bacterium]